MSEYDDLRRLAQAATPGPWFVDGPFWWRGGDRDPDCTHVITFGKNRAPVCVMPEDSQRRSEFVDHDAAFIAAANPATVIALLDERDRWEAEKQEIYAAHAQLIQNQRTYHEAERDADRADLAAANARADKAELEAVGWAEEANALRADIERVRAVLAEHWDWKAGRSLHAAMTAALAADTPTTAAAEGSEG